jgi:methylenetetrahydrofolate reductase (NADPH)
METRPKPSRVVEALRRPRYEVIPLDGVEQAVLEHVPKEEVTLTVTSSPVKGVGPTLDLAERLSGHGYGVIPHLAARLVGDGAHLAEILDRVRRMGARGLFVIAGDADEPAGRFEGAVDLLRAMAETGHGLDETGISGYPESHPLISDEATIQAMFEKAPYATHIVSQICFDPGVIDAWVRAVRERGVGLPLFIGLPGPVSNQKLLRVSAKIGLGESARFLRKQRSWLPRLLLPGGYRPERLLRGLGPTIEDPGLGVVGLHIYTFNELGGIESWRRGLIERFGTA